MPDLVVRAGGYAPRESTHSRALEVFAAGLSEATSGRVETEILWNILDTGRSAPELLESVEEGTLDLCYFSTSYLGSRVPALDVLEIPFLFGDLDAAHRALDGALGELLTARTEEVTPYRVLGYWDNGFRHLSNRTHRVRSPQDVAGMRIRLQPNPIHEAMVAGWGGVPVPAELSRGIEMIVSGEVDAQENPLANTVAYGADRVHPFVTMTGHLYGARGLYAHGPFMERLGAEMSDAVRQAARRAILFQRSAAAEYERELRARLERSGTEFADPTYDERRDFVVASAQAIELATARVGEDLVALASREEIS